ncbi:unnamed protein product [Cochlearia groenlandica]
MARVIVASLRKVKAPMARDLASFHELPLIEYEQKGAFPINATSSLRRLAAAARTAGRLARELHAQPPSTPPSKSVGAAASDRRHSVAEKPSPPRLPASFPTESTQLTID